MLSRNDLLARLRPENRRLCPMDMSPESIACREGRPPPSRAPSLPFLPRAPPSRAPPVDDCPPHPIICNQSMTRGAIECREKAKRCAKTRMPVRPVLQRPFPQFSEGIFTPSIVGTVSDGFIGGKKKRGRPRKVKEPELEGGFLGALGALARLGSTAARVGSTAARGATAAARGATAAARSGATAARSGATRLPITRAPIRPTVRPTVRAPTRPTRPTTTPTRSTLSTLGSRAMGVGNVAALGLGIGLPIYQIVEMKKQQKEQERLAAEGDAQAAENAKAIQAAIDAAEEQQRFFEEQGRLAGEDRVRQEAEFKKAEADLQKQYEEQARKEAAAMEQARRDQEEQIALLYELEAQRQQQIEEAIMRSLSGLFAPPPPPPPPVRPPTQPPAPPTQPPAPPPRQPAPPPPPPSAPSGPRPRGKPSVGSGKRGRPRKVKFDDY